MERLSDEFISLKDGLKSFDKKKYESMGGAELLKMLNTYLGQNSKLPLFRSTTLNDFGVSINNSILGALDGEINDPNSFGLENILRKAIKRKYGEVNQSDLSNSIKKIIELLIFVKSKIDTKNLKESIHKQNNILYSARVYLSYLQNIKDNQKDSEEIQEHIDKINKRITIIGNSSMTSEELNSEIDAIFSFDDILNWYDLAFSGSKNYGKHLYDKNLSVLRNLLKEENVDRSKLNRGLSYIGESIGEITGKLDRTVIADDTLGISDPRTSKEDKNKDGKWTKDGDAPDDYKFSANSGLEDKSNKSNYQEQINKFFEIIRDFNLDSEQQKGFLFKNIKDGNKKEVKNQLRSIFEIKGLDNELINDFLEDNDFLEELVEQISKIKENQVIEVRKIQQRLMAEKDLLVEESKKRPNDQKLKNSIKSLEKVLNNSYEFAEVVFESSLDVMIIQTIGHNFMSSVLKKDESLENKHSLYADIVGTGFFNPSDGDFTSRLNIAEEVAIQAGLLMISLGFANIAELGVTSITKLAISKLGQTKIGTGLASSRVAQKTGEILTVSSGLIAKAGTFMLTNDYLNNLRVGDDWDEAGINAWKEATKGKFVGDLALFGIFKFITYIKGVEKLNPGDKIKLTKLKELGLTISAINLSYLSPSVFDGKNLEITAEELAYLVGIGIILHKTGGEIGKLELSRVNGVLRIGEEKLTDFAKNLSSKLKGSEKVNPIKPGRKINLLRNLKKTEFKNGNKLTTNKSGNEILKDPKGKIIVERTQDGKVVNEPFGKELSGGSISLEITPKGYEEFAGVKWRIKKEDLEILKSSPGNEKLVTLYSENGYTVKINGKVVENKLVLDNKGVPYSKAITKETLPE